MSTLVDLQPKIVQKIINDTKGKKQKELNNQFHETLIKKLKIEQNRFFKTYKQTL